MKLLGISAGRKMGNSEILLKEALMAAEEAGDIDVEIIRLHDLKIRFCTGCETCTQSMSKGEEGGCIIKNDDMPFLKEKFTECDGLILSAPVFEIRPPGIYCTMNDRFLGFGPQYLMDVYKRKRVGASISVGGGDWVQLALPQMSLAFFMLNMKVVDQLQATWSAREGHVLLHDNFIARAKRLGQNVAEAMKKGGNEAEYMGDDPGACPYCHSNLLEVGSKSVVLCPICGIRGDLKVEGDDIKIDWYEDDINNIRWEPAGMGAHFKDIKENHATYEQNIGIIKDKKEKYKAYKSYSRPQKKE